MTLPVLLDEGISPSFGAGFFFGPATSASASDIGTTWDVAIGGHPYILDMDLEGGQPGYSVKSLPLLQRYFLTQQTGNIGEQSLNPEDYWRRSVDSWANGAGQAFNDHDPTGTNPGSTRTQYRSSKGIYPWEPGQISLLPDTQLNEASANTNLALAVAGTDLHYLDGNTWSTSTDGEAFSPLSGPALNNAHALASDGFNTWVTDDTDTYYTTRGSSTYSTWFASPLPGTLVRSAKGRLFVCAGNVIHTSNYNPGAATAATLYTHPNTDFVWVDVSEGPTAIYFAGFSGDKSIIYQTAIAPDGTNLVIPTAAATLPSGETVHAITGYVGVLMIGTDKGVRGAAIDSQGNLTVGDLIVTGQTCACFEPQEHFAWFGWPNYDTTSSGLGRIDLGLFNDSAPAYASDLMADATGPVTSVVTFGEVRHFTVAGSGLWSQTDTLVASGTIDSGGLNYSLPDVKIAVKFDISYLAGAGTIDVALSTDARPFLSIGLVDTSSVQGSNAVIPAGLVSGRTHEVRLTLARDSGDHTVGPVVDRWTLLSNPAPERRVMITAALLLHHQMKLRNGADRTVDTLEEREQIDVWMQSNEVVTFQDAERAYPVTVDDYEWRAADQVDPKQRVWDGTLIVTMKVVS